MNQGTVDVYALYSLYYCMYTGFQARRTLSINIVMRLRYARIATISRKTR